jgi:hypothetical protein
VGADGVHLIVVAPELAGVRATVRSRSRVVGLKLEAEAGALVRSALARGEEKLR